jgi:predicted transcriptional regulator
MSNIMENGAVLPHGLLGNDAEALLDGFKKTYKNFSLRVGVVMATYPKNNTRNHSKLAIEYDVLVVEQNEDKGATTILYRNCLSAEGLGSIADFFEKSLRSKKKKTKKGDATDLKGQNGAIVLLLCLDSMSDKGIIIGALTHPDRETTLTDEGPRLEGEYNGVNVKVEKDGSCTLMFKGATDNDGKVLDKTQGNTTVKIEKDGSYQVDHKTIKQRFDKKGKADLTADDDISNTTKKNFNITATENITLKATKDMNIDCEKLLAKASGSAMLECQKLEIKSQSEITLKGSQIQIEAESMAKIKATSITLDGMVALGGAGGQPILLLSTQFIGVGNLGAPVMSTAIAGFATKVTAS